MAPGPYREPSPWAKLADTMVVETPDGTRDLWMSAAELAAIAEEPIQSILDGVYSGMLTAVPTGDGRFGVSLKSFVLRYCDTGSTEAES
jgi:hypothetical protein